MLRDDHRQRIPVSNCSWTVVNPLAPTSTGFDCDDGARSGASAAGVIRYVPGARNTVKWPSVSEWKSVRCFPPSSTPKVALKGASHGTSTRHTGVIGPRETVPVSPVVGVGAVAAQPETQRTQRNNRGNIFFRIN